MEGKRLIQRMTLQNFLSFGKEGVSLEMLPLNVLIGPNGSGKSNLIESFAVLRATALDLPAVFRAGGGVSEYTWKGADAAGITKVGAVIESPFREIFYDIAWTTVRNRLEVTDEAISRAPASPIGTPEALFEIEGSVALIRPSSDPQKKLRGIRRSELANDQSILSQRKDPDQYPELTHLGSQFAQITIFQDWTFGRRTQARAPQATDLPVDFLLPDGSNLVLVLHGLLQQRETEEKLVENLRRFYQSAQRIRTGLQGGRIELVIEEEGNVRIPGARLSDGTLRYLSLLAILLHPSPPPLICIEEPELGLHPDIMPTIAELLRDASQRTQLVVTTHSDALVSALSDVPESVVVCESSPDGTLLRRLDREALAEWLNRYSLGEIWRMGEIGGTRW